MISFVVFDGSYLSESSVKTNDSSNLSKMFAEHRKSRFKYGNLIRTPFV